MTVVAGQIDGSNSDELKQICRFDPDIPSGTFVSVYKLALNDDNLTQLDRTERGLRHIVVSGSSAGTAKINNTDDTNISAEIVQVRRLTQLSGSHREDIATNKDIALLVFTGSAAQTGEIDDNNAPAFASFSNKLLVCFINFF